MRHSYDGQARATLHREAGLVAELASRAANTRPTNPVSSGSLQPGPARLYGSHAGGAPDGPSPWTPADLAAARAGQTLSVTRTVNGRRYLVEVAPVADDGGVILAQRASVAVAVTRSVLRRFLGALAIGLLFARLLGVYLARRISRPLSMPLRRPTGWPPAIATSGCSPTARPRWRMSPTVSTPSPPPSPRPKEGGGSSCSPSATSCGPR